MSFQRDRGILVAAVAAYENPPRSSQWLLESASRYGIQLTLLGQNEPYPNDLRKMDLVAKYLQAHPEIQYVLAVDFKDVIFCATLREMFHKYQSFGHEIVAAAERVSWPLASHASRSPETGTSFRYLNAGTIFATAEAWRSSWRKLQQMQEILDGGVPEIGHCERSILNCDQAAWSELYVTGAADIALDSRCDLFQTLATIDREIGTSNRDLKFEGRRVVNRETSGRPCLIHGNANVPLSPWARYILRPSPVWNGPLIDRIRTAPLDHLRDPARVEELLLDLGIHDPIDGFVPDSLLPFTGKGLCIWQRPAEFARYLTWLAARPPIRSYAEIGIESGGSFITTIEYLRRFHPLRVAVGVDPYRSPFMADYVPRTAGVHFVQGTCASRELQELLQEIGEFDLGFIDGDHSDAGVRTDWQFARAFSRYVGFHDIAGESLPGVTSLWSEIQSRYQKTYEFIDSSWKPSLWAGIGIVDLAYGQR